MSSAPLTKPGVDSSSDGPGRFSLDLWATFDGFNEDALPAASAPQADADTADGVGGSMEATAPSNGAEANGAEARSTDRSAPQPPRRGSAHGADGLVPGLTAELRARLVAGDSDESVVAAALAAPAGEEAAEDLMDLVSFDDARLQVRVEAAQALGAMGVHAAVATLARAATSPHVELRRAAVTALASMAQAHGASAALVKACSDPDRDVRCSALAGLLVIGGPLASQAAVDALTDAEPQVRCAAVVIIRRHGNARAYAAVAGVVDDVDASVRRAARVALAEWLG